MSLRTLNLDGDAQADHGVVKILHVEGGHFVGDREHLGAIDNIQSLATGLSAKIWQKIVILDTLALHVDVPDVREPRRSIEDAVSPPHEAL